MQVITLLCKNLSPTFLLQLICYSQEDVSEGFGSTLCLDVLVLSLVMRHFFIYTSVAHFCYIQSIFSKTLSLGLGLFVLTYFLAMSAGLKLGWGVLG